MRKKKQKQIENLRINVYYDVKHFEHWVDRFIIINLGTGVYVQSEIEKEIDRVLTVISGCHDFRVNKFFKRIED